MRTISGTFLVALGVIVKQAAATGWTDAESFSCISNTDNQCNPNQNQGFNWNGLPTGEFEEYGEFKFAGFKCSDSFNAEENLPTAETFQSKCIKGSVEKDASSGPRISYGAGKRFSIKELQISSSEDIDVELVYLYENGDKCKHTAPCSKGGSTIQNTQCGGATEVYFQLPSHVDRSSCEIGIHHVAFECGPPTTRSRTTPSAPLIPSASNSIPHVPGPSPGLSITYAIPSGNFTRPTGTAPAISAPVESSTSSAPPYSPPASSLPASSPEISSPAISAPVESSTSSATLADSTSVAEITHPIITSVQVYTTVTTCPVTNTVTSGTSVVVEKSFTLSTVVHSVTSTICTKCVAPTHTPVPTSEGSTPPALGSSTPPVAESPTPTPVLSSPGAVFLKSSPTVSVPETSAVLSPNESSVQPPFPSAPAITKDAVVTVILRSTVTTCPVTNTITSGTSIVTQITTTVSTIFNTITSTICTKCIEPHPTPAPSAPEELSSTTQAPSVPAPPVESSPPAPHVPAPSLLPKCLNTWITLTACKDNADADCYCKDSTFTSNVQGCISSWTEDLNVIQAALSYLAGICAPHVSENPGIVTNVPVTITLCPTPAVAPATSTGPAPTGGDVGTPISTPPVRLPVTFPATKLTIIKTLTVAGTYSSGPSAGKPIPSSSTTSVLSTEVTVPQVKFTTQRPVVGATGTPSVGLAAGSPAPAEATPTGVYPLGASVGTTFATGVLATGQGLATNPTLAAFTGGADRMRLSIAGTMGVVLVGFLIMF